MTRKYAFLLCRELTKRELKSTNGCGSSFVLAWPFRIPRWISKAFTRCCNRHDLRYQRRKDKAFADDELLDCMYYDAYHSNRWQKWYKLKLADFTYKCLNTKLSQKCYDAAKKGSIL